MELSITFIKSLFLKSPRYLILQLSSTGIFCALASIKHNALLIHIVEYTPCNDNEITPTSIANPSKLLKIAHLFLDQHSQTTLPLICFSSLLRDTTCKPEQVLQHLLFLSSISGPVIGLYSNSPLNNTIGNNTLLPVTLSELPNLIDYITTADIRTWPQRLRRCVLIIIIPLCGIIGYQWYKARTLKAIRKKETQLNDYMNQLKPRVQKIKELEKQNSILKDRISTIQDLTEEQEIPAHICQAIAKHIPANTWLTEICIGQKITNTRQANKKLAEKLLKGPALKKIPLCIEGKTTDPDEISIFLEALTTALPTSTLSIDHISRTRQEKQVEKRKETLPYNFKLTGIIELEE